MKIIHNQMNLGDFEVLPGSCHYFVGIIDFKKDIKISNLSKEQSSSTRILN